MGSLIAGLSNTRCSPYVMVIQPALAKSEVADWPIIGAGARRMQTLFVKRESVSSRAASKQAIFDKIQTAGTSIYIAGFPSGTTSLIENRPWKKGLFEIAMKTDTDVQCFKINYSPLRACAYIDDDNLFACLMNLFSTRNKVVSLEWGASQKITNLSEQMMSIQNWTQNQNILDEETLIGPPRSLEFQ